MPQGRTPLFRKLTQTVQQAQWLNRHPQHRALFFEARDASRVSRRDFVRMLSAAGLLTAAGGFAPRFAQGGETLKRSARGGDPVAIIGAGVAGLTAAYRLLQAGVPCEIFEGSDRTGGRMLTKTDFNKDGDVLRTGRRVGGLEPCRLDRAGGRTRRGNPGTQRRVIKASISIFSAASITPTRNSFRLFQPFAKKLAADLEGIYDAEENFTEKAARFDRISLAANISPRPARESRSGSSTCCAWLTPSNMAATLTNSRPLISLPC